MGRGRLCGGRWGQGEPVCEVILQHYEIDRHRWLVHLPPGLLLRLPDGRCEFRCSEPRVQPCRFRQQDWVLFGHLAGRQGRHYGENQQGEAAWLRRGCVRGFAYPIAQRRRGRFGWATSMFSVTEEISIRTLRGRRSTYLGLLR